MTKVEIAEKRYGKFKYTELKGGEIKINSAWIKDNIVTIKVPIIDRIECHIKIAKLIEKVFILIDPTLIDVKDTKSIGGCFVPRHMLFNKLKPLSLHSWGIALDINPTKNWYGTKGTPQQKVLAKVFKDNGFVWGGDWFKVVDGIQSYKTCDPMHMQIRLEG